MATIDCIATNIVTRVTGTATPDTNRVVTQDADHASTALTATALNLNTNAAATTATVLTRMAPLHHTSILSAAVLDNDDKSIAQLADQNAEMRERVLNYSSIDVSVLVFYLEVEKTVGGKNK